MEKNNDNNDTWKNTRTLKVFMHRAISKHGLCDQWAYYPNSANIVQINSFDVYVLHYCRPMNTYNVYLLADALWVKYKVFNLYTRALTWRKVWYLHS